MNILNGIINFFTFVVNICDCTGKKVCRFTPLTFLGMYFPFHISIASFLRRLFASQLKFESPCKIPKR